MTLGQMKALTEYANEQIDSYAGNNNAFDRDRVAWRENLNIEEGQKVFGVTPFAFALRNDGYTVLLDGDNEIVHVDRFRA